jgi:hypothetical protein
MKTKNRSNPPDLNCRLNYSAGILLLGSVIFGSQNMLNAAEKQLSSKGYVLSPGLGSQAEDLYWKFEKNLEMELNKDPETKSLMFEAMLSGYDCDTTIESRAAYEECIQEKFGKALKRTLKESGLYEEIKEGLRSEAKKRFSRRNDDKQDFASNTPEREPHRSKSYIFGAENLDTGINASIGSDGIDVQGSLTLENFGLGGLMIKKGKLVAGNQGLRLTLERAISNEIYSIFHIKVEDFEDPKTSLGLSLTGKRNPLGRWILSAGYSTGGDEEDNAYVSLGLVKLLK